MSAPGRPQALGLKTKLAYGFGSAAYGIKDNGLQTLLLLFYNQIVGLRSDLVGMAIFAALVLDAFVDPAIGRWTDRTSSRWGRRHPFMVAAAIPVGVLYVLLWNPPRTSSTETMIFLVVVAVLARTAISTYEIPSSALAPELTADYDERTSLLGYRYLFSWIGGMTMAFVTFVFIMAPSPDYPVGQLNPVSYRVYSWVAAVAMVVAILVSAWGTPVPARRVGAPPAHDGVPRPAIWSTFKNKAFIMLMASGVFSFASTGLTFALSTYFNTYLWALDASVFGIFTAALLIGAVGAFWLAQSLSRRFGKKIASIWVMASYPPVAIAPYALWAAGAFPHAGDAALLPLLMVFMALAATLGTAGAILGASMMSDVVEDAELRTGERSEGTYFAGSFFMQKCVSGLGLFLAGGMLSIVNFPSGAAPGTGPAPVLSQLVLLYVGVLISLGAFATWFIICFPLGGRGEHETRLARLSAIASHALTLPESEAEYPASDSPPPHGPAETSIP